MFQSDNPPQKFWIYVIAGASLCLFVTSNLHKTEAAESGCITCHLDKEMLKKNVTVQQGQKSTMQSGAG